MLSKIKLYIYCLTNIKQIILTIYFLRQKTEQLEERILYLEARCNNYYKIK